MRITYRFQKVSRLLTALQFKAVFRKAKTYRLRSFKVLVRENELGHPRIGFAISKKQCRLAVARNRVKRQMRESFRLKQSELPGVDIVILSGQGIERRTNGELRSAMEELWGKLISSSNNSR